MKRIISLILLLILTSCANKKDVLYLQDLERNKTEKISQSYIYKFQVDDVLNIVVSSADNQGVSPFNTTPTASISSSDNSSSKPKTSINYVIRQDGTIQFPVLGNVKLEGLSMLEATELLKQNISKYVNNPIVTIDWINFKFTILGEVNNPGLFKSNSERITLIEAIGLAGDLGIQADRKNILLIREIGKNRYTYNIDITNKAFINSEVYYIKQNDQIIVSPNNAKIQSSIVNPSVNMYFSIVSTAISLITLIAIFK